jgi:hypothetical protein
VSNNVHDTRMGDWWSKGYTIRALCQCGAERQVPSASILKLFGQEHHWKEGFDNERMAKALVCGTCKRKGLATVRVVIE